MQHSVLVEKNRAMLSANNRTTMVKMEKSIISMSWTKIQCHNKVTAAHLRSKNSATRDLTEHTGKGSDCHECIHHLPGMEEKEKHSINNCMPQFSIKADEKG